MILPKDQPLHECLHTSFVNFAQLLQSLCASGFTGYLELLDWNYSGVVLVEKGNLIGAIEELDGGRLYGLPALDRLRSRAVDQDAVIGVYGLDDTLVALFTRLAQATTSCEQQSTDTIAFHQLMARIQEDEFTGHLEMRFADGSAGIVFLEKGYPIAIIHVKDRITRIGEAALDRITEGANARAAFSLYACDARNLMATDFVHIELIEAWRNLLAMVEQSVDDATTRGSFKTEFLRSCLENVREYSFLDPFSGAFEFTNKGLTFDGTPNGEQFTAGLTAALKSVSVKVGPRGALALRNALQVAQSQCTQAKERSIARELSKYFGDVTL
jgi:hypothetical protein